MDEATFPTRQQPIHETETIAHDDDEDEMPMPKIERMYKPRGTLTEKDRRETFERGPMDLAARSGGTVASANGASVTSNGTVSRLTPKSDSRHVPSGPRDLKDFDQPAYLRRGIALPPMDESMEDEAMPVMQETRQSEMPEQKPVRDDRPAFLKRIMD
jgi:hypothetical protein